jgi:very-short-patch-repair endonuclease
VDRSNVVIGARVDPAKLERAKRLRRDMTPAEHLLWRALRTNRLAGAHFRRQQVIAGFIADFYCHAARLVIELDGGVHASRGEYDAERDGVLAAHGLRVVRFTNDEVRRDLPAVLTRIEAAVNERRALSRQRRHG